MEDGGHRILLIRSGRLLEVVAVPGACDHQRTTEEKAGSISSGRGRGGLVSAEAAAARGPL